MNSNTEEERIREILSPKHLFNHNEQFIAIVELAYHVAVYVNVDHNFGYDDRFCVSNVDLALIAVEEYKKTGKFKYWQKHHNERISISGNKAYRSGALMVPENVLFEVEWNAEELRKAHPQTPLF